MYFEGFHGASDVAEMDVYLPRRGYTITPNPSADTGRFVGISLSISEDYCSIPVSANASYTVCFAFKTLHWLHYTANEKFLDINNVAGTQISLQLAGDGEIAIVTPEDTVKTTDLRGKDDTWTFVEFKCVIHDTLGSYTLKVNGKEYFNRTGIDTHDAGNVEITAFKFKWYRGGNKFMAFDDIYIGDDFLGDYRIDRIDPDGNGAVTDWTPLVGTNYEEVDDGNSVDDDTTYNAGGDGDQDLYTYSDLSALGIIHAVQTNIVCRETDANDFNIEQLARIDTTIYDEPPHAIAGQTYEILARVMEENPATSSAWTLDDINAAQFGFEGSV